MLEGYSMMGSIFWIRIGGLLRDRRSLKLLTGWRCFKEGGMLFVLVDLDLFLQGSALGLDLP